MFETATLVAIPHALYVGSAVYAKVQAGQTIAQMLVDDVASTCEVTVGGYPVPSELWTRLRPKAGAIIHATVYPAGGGAGEVLRSMAMIAVTVMA